MKMSYEEFLKLVDRTHNNFDWRYGQALMNVLSVIWSDKSEEIVASDNDPYYDDRFVPEILKELKANWNPTSENIK